MQDILDRYVVFFGDIKLAAFGDDLEDAIGYAADARTSGRARGHNAEVWTTRCDVEPDGLRRVWP